MELNMKQILPLSAVGLTFVLASTILYAQNEAKGLEGEWKLEKVTCADKNQEIELNKRIDQGHFGFTITFEADRFRETIDEKTKGRRIMAITVGTHTMNPTQKQLILNKSSTSLTEGGRSSLLKWSSDDLHAQKQLGYELSAHGLVIEAQDACDDSRGSLLFKKI
jgi:hypothetical protein